MEDLKRIRWITANYRRLQGLKWLPWYIWFLTIGSVYAVAFPDSTPLNSLLDLYPCLPLLLSAVVPWWVSKQIGEYYKRTFGNVFYEHTTAPDEQKQDSRPIPWYKVFLMILIASAIVGLVVGWVILWEYLTEQLHLSDTLLYIAAILMLPNVWNKGRIIIHYLIITIILAALAILPLSGLLPRDFWLGPFGIPLDLITGCLALVATGVFDHLTLIRALKRMPEDGDDADV